VVYRQRRLSVPADTPQDDPATEEFNLPAGQIRLVTVEYPLGCNGMVYFQLMQSNNPIVPDEPLTGIVGNDVTLQLPIVYDLEVGKTTLTLRGWSPGTTKAHNLNIGVAILTKLEQSREEEYLKDTTAYLKGIAAMLGVK